MSVLPIITLPDPLLRQVSAPIEQVDDEIRKLADDMLETMYDAPGVGLAAVQVGVLKRMLVLDAANDSDEDGDDAPERRPMCLINPEIVAKGDTLRSHEEGCLSIPDVRVDIERPGTITVRYVDRDGAQQEMEADGLTATVIQHEVDHLDGKLIVDYMSRLRRDMVIRRFKKLAKNA